MTKIKGEKSTNSMHAFLEFFVVVFISIVNPGALSAGKNVETKWQDAY